MAADGVKVLIEGLTAQRCHSTVKRLTLVDDRLAATGGRPAINRLLVVVGLGICLTACTGTVPASRQTPQASALSVPTAATSSPAPAPTPTPRSSPIAWQHGIVAYPVGSSASPLPYLEFLPPGYGDGPPRPLLVFLHGVDGEATGSEVSLRKILELGIPRMIMAGTWSSERPFVVLMPQEPMAKSQRCDFGREIKRFLDFAVNRYAIDESRMYLTGISCGAIGIWDYLAVTESDAAAADAVAAAVPIAGHPDWAMTKAGCAVARGPIWAFNGALDDIIPLAWLNDRMKELRACTDPRPNELEFTVYQDADHDAWTRTYDLSAGHDIYGWLLEHRRQAR